MRRWPRPDAAAPCPAVHRRRRRRRRRRSRRRRRAGRCTPPACRRPRSRPGTTGRPRSGTTSNAITRRSTIAHDLRSRSERSRVDAERMKRSPPPMTASTPCSTPVQNGSPTLAVTTPIIEAVPRVRSRRANWLGRKPSSSAARRTRSTLSGRTLASLLRARDTVLGETPARPATSVTVGARRGGAALAHRTSSRHDGRRVRRPTPDRRSRRRGRRPRLRRRRRPRAQPPRRFDRARGPRAWRRAVRRRHRSG